MSEIRGISHQRRHWWAWVSWYAFYYVELHSGIAICHDVSLSYFNVDFFLGKGSQGQGLIQAGKGFLRSHLTGISVSDILSALSQD